MTNLTEEPSAAKKLKMTEKQEINGYFDFPSDRVASMVFNSFGHDEEPPRSKVEKQLLVEGNRLKFSLRADNQKSLNKTLESLSDCVTLVQSTLFVASGFGGQLNENERTKLAEPIVQVITAQ
ncbi:hypothetical protein M3Y94_00190700 [Aphelenchoides besseyi]|nr:hypothetical protein M3Y94_00190700 [Aphelenchoides besseyi]KAI6236796.1 hypothetical protein M3Y95_00196500 [Aphelenchoides besseyi]